MGTFHCGAHVRRAGGRFFHRVWSAALWVEARRNGLSRKRNSARRVRAHGRTRSQRNRFERSGPKTNRRPRRAEEQKALAARAYLPRRTRCQSDLSLLFADRLLFVLW